MNPFVVSARKYRPATFDTVVGQAHITNTLKNAIRTNHLAQAFLFCGPRGVGKTTCARILAKTLNCRKLTPDIEACNNCESCLSFNSGQSLNIYELDAASNNSVDDIRGLVEQVRYAPHSGEYKIYIIDEVHMLSTSAFNAFLKTLEEPPSYAIFILATTEKHKIIPTILSRCQIFDFNRIEVDDIAHHLAYVSGKEGVQADEEALHIIAQKADGALRDALSIFDQIVSFAGNHVSYKDVISNLSILDYDYYFEVTEAIRHGNIPAVLLTFNKLLNEGFDGHQFINGLAAHFRDLLVSKDEITLPLLEVSKSTRERYRQQSAMLSQSHLLKFLGVCSQCDIDYRMAKNQRLHVELALLRLCGISAPIVSDQPIAQEAEKKNLTESPSASQPVVRSNFNAASTKPISSSEPAKAPDIQSETDKTASEIVKIISPAVEAAVTDDAAQISTNIISGNPKIAVPPPKSEAKTATPFLRARSMTQLGAQQEAEKKQGESAEISGHVQADEFTNEDFKRVWNEYAEKIKKEGRFQLFTTLTMTPPEIENTTEIILTVHNPSQQELIVEESNALMDFIRTKLNNYLLTLKTRLDPTSTDPELVYTNKEKYLKMAEKNPGLDDFRKQLGLELEL